MGRRLWCALVLAWVPLVCPAAMPGEDTIFAYAYDLKPPLIVDQDQGIGLYYDFAVYVNQKLRREALRTEYMPRKRLDIMLASPGFKGIVIGANPIWFGDSDRKKYLWTAPLMHDRDEVASRTDRPIDYEGPASLHGLVIGLPRGNYYFGIDEDVKLGLIVREDTDSELQNLQKLERGRIAATIVSHSMLDYLGKVEGWHPAIHLSPKPHDEFDRDVMVPLQQRDVYSWLEPLMEKMPSDPDWQKMAAKYR